jgi:Putative auto-transporter adhesin, head GIN domain
MGAGRAPLIIAGVAAVVAYVAIGDQSPLGFLHHLGLGGHHHTITISTDKSDDMADAARDAAEAARDKAQEERDRAQELRDRAQELAENAKELARADTEKAKDALIAAIPPAPPIPDAPPAPPAPGVSGENTEVRALEPFDNITIENNADVTVTIGDQQSVMLTGAGHTETRVHDGKLTVSGSMPGARVAIIVPHLRALQVNGYGKVSLVGLRDPIAIKANGAVQLWGSGAVDSAELTLNGPSKFALSKLEAKNLVVQINGVGDADVNATETLVADVKGVGHVSYRGSPHLVTSIKGPGSVQHVASNEG